MKKLLLLGMVLAVHAEPARAAHYLGVYADAAGTSCQISDPGGGATQSLYIFHKDEVGGAIGSAWRLTWDPGMSMVWIGDSTPFSMVGNSKDGAAVSYSTCHGGTFLIDTVTMTSLGTSAPCSHVTLGAHPTQGRNIFFCNFAGSTFTTGDAIVNGDGSCRCTVATEPATWGRVKALYR